MTLQEIIPAEAQETLIAMGWSMNKMVLTSENCHDLISIEEELRATRPVFADSLAIVEEDDRLKITSAGDQVILTPDSKGKISFTVQGMTLPGKLRNLVIKHMMDKVGIIDTYTFGDWQIYIFMWNDTILQAGFMDSKEYGMVSYCKVYRPRRDYNEPSREEYYRMWSDKRRVWRAGLSISDPENEAYGDNAAGLGSVYTEQVRYTLDEIYATLSKIKDDPEYAMEIEALRELLEITPDDC